jgi:DNA-binding LytR/AlgR family response regulator
MLTSVKICFQLLGNQYVLLSIHEIIWLEADRQICYVNLKDGTKLTVAHHLGNYKDRLMEQFHFLEISRSSLVNPEYLTLYNPKDRTITLSSGQHLILSKQKQGLLNTYFKSLHDHWG